MPLLVKVLAGIAVFVFLWIGVTKLPVPAETPWLRSLLYVVLCVAAAIVVWVTFVGG